MACIDPRILYSNPDRSHLSIDEEETDEEVGNVLASQGKGNGHIFNLGHGIHPKIDPENVIEKIGYFDVLYQ